MSIAAQTAVVFDVNVYLDHIYREDAWWPLLAEVPPFTSNPSADAISLAFGSRFQLFCSPHILRNVRDKALEAEHSESRTHRYLALISELCEFSGGAIVDPVLSDLGIGDHEDNNILALARDPAVDAMIVVSRDRHLLDLGAWNGRLMMHPRDFVRRVLR